MSGRRTDEVRTWTLLARRRRAGAQVGGLPALGLLQDVEQGDGAAGALGAVAMSMTVESNVPFGERSGSRGSGRLHGNVLPWVGVGTQTPFEVAAMGAASGSLAPVCVSWFGTPAKDKRHVNLR